MYFPRTFSTRRAIELGDLINQAYDQFHAFENKTPWSLTGDYSLTGEISYVWTPTRAIEKGLLGFDIALDKIWSNHKESAVRVPIGFVARKRECRYLIFRGTKTVKEWIRNIDIELSPFILPGFGKVHDGFLRTYDSIRNEVSASLSAAKSARRLFVAGHSLGAAMATLAVPDIEKTLSLNVEALYTFGSPRVGDATFASAFNREAEGRSFRITNTSDIVTSIPLPAPIAGRIGGYFSHVGTPVDMTVQEDDLEKNHSMKVYLSELREHQRAGGFLGWRLKKRSS